MLKKTIIYTNPFTEKEVTEEHYFHISKSDLVEMEMEEHGSKYEKDGKELTGMQAKLQRVIDSEDGKAIMTEFKDIIRRAYGKKDGDRFLKSAAIWEDFSATEAFSQLLWELCTNADEAAEFMNGIVPGNLEEIAAEVRAQAVKEETAEQTTTPEQQLESVEPLPDSAEKSWEQVLQAATPENPVTLTRIDLAKMNDSDLRSGLAEGRYKLS